MIFHRFRQQTRGTRSEMESRRRIVDRVVREQLPIVGFGKRAGNSPKEVAIEVTRIGPRRCGDNLRRRYEASRNGECEGEFPARVHGCGLNLALTAVSIGKMNSVCVQKELMRRAGKSQGLSGQKLTLNSAMGWLTDSWAACDGYFQSLICGRCVRFWQWPFYWEVHLSRLESSYGRGRSIRKSVPTFASRCRPPTWFRTPCSLAPLPLRLSQCSVIWVP